MGKNTSAALARKERKERLKQRQRDQAKRRNEGMGGSGILDLSQFPDITMHKIVEGKNLIDILPYIVATDKHPQLSKGEEDYKLDVYQHSNVGPKRDRVVCLLETFNKPCPICEDYHARVEKKEDKDSKAMKDLRPSRRVFYNILDLNHPDKGLQILHLSHFKFEKEIYDQAEYDGEAFTTFADLDDGYSIKFRGAKERHEGRAFIEPKNFSFVERDEPYDDSVLEETYPLDQMLRVHTYDEIEAMYYHLNDDEEGDEEDDEIEEAPKRGALLKRKTKKLQSAKTSGKSKTKKEADEPDDIDDDDLVDPVEDDDTDVEEEHKGDCFYAHEFSIEHQQTDDCSDCFVDTKANYMSCFTEALGEWQCPYEHEIGIEFDQTSDCTDCSELTEFETEYTMCKALRASLDLQETTTKADLKKGTTRKSKSKKGTTLKSKSKSKATSLKSKTSPAKRTISRNRNRG